MPGRDRCPRGTLPEGTVAEGRGRLLRADDRVRSSRTVSAESTPAKTAASGQWFAGRRRTTGTVRGRDAATVLAAWRLPARPPQRDRPCGRGNAPTAVSRVYGNRRARSRN